jgi:hypothetical protein
VIYARDRIEEEFRGHINDRQKQLEKGMTQRVFAVIV